MQSILRIAYRSASYTVFLTTMFYFAGFITGIVVPRSVDSVSASPLGNALWIDLALVGLFAAQHSVMARQSFKKWWTRFVPEPLERSTYVLFASLALLLLFWQWRPIPALVWSVANRPLEWLLYGIAIAGGITSVAASLLIDHAGLFGLKPAKEQPFRTPGLYKYVRHPIYSGSIAAMWSTPRMSAGHLLFAAAMTAYIFIGVLFEERDLVRKFGTAYQRYQEAVPMILPLPAPPAKR